MKFSGRLKPYTEIGIRRIPCSRCGAPSTQQWQVCANGRRYLGVCVSCDIAINEMVMKFMRIPRAATLMKAYRSQLHP